MISISKSMGKKRDLRHLRSAPPTPDPRQDKEGPPHSRILRRLETLTLPPSGDTITKREGLDTEKRNLEDIGRVVITSRFEVF